MERAGAAEVDALIEVLVSGVRRRPFFIASTLFMAVLITVSWTEVISQGSSGSGLLTLDTWRRGGDFVGDLAGVGSEKTPAFFEWLSWRSALGLAGATLVMSVLAAGFAAAGAIVTMPFAAFNLAGRNPGGRIVAWVVRAIYIFSRAVPELAWALIVVFVFNPGVLAGAMALAIHNFGVLGRVGAETVENIDPWPVESLKTSGAGRVQLLFYGVLPQVLPQFVTYLLYRWEVMIRTSVVVGLVAAVGLGYQFRLDLAFFRYTDVALLLIIYVLLVWAVDLASIGLRRLAR
ncbi:MAG: ABC transporter permease subunit [Chloroflexi bacterium]|nr:ABC transporter permease subunit [Chloroflexota bacterium]